MAGVVKIHFSYANMLPGQGEDAKSMSGGEYSHLEIMRYIDRHINNFTALSVGDIRLVLSPHYSLVPNFKIG